ncbi:MAG: glutaredoxin family protein [Syntrophorhabdales bacterium]
MKKVVMYSLSTCPWCMKAKKYFEEQGVAYDYVDYDRADDQTQQNIYREMHDIEAGGFPVVKIGRDVVVGYKPDEYKELLRQGSAQ